MGLGRNLKFMGRIAGLMLKNPGRARGIYNNIQNAKRDARAWAEEQIQRAKVGIEDWREMLDFFEDDHNPDREKMMELYQEIDLDDQVTAKRQAVQLGITGTEYYLYDTKTKKEVPDLKANIFDRRWFIDYLNHAVDAIFYGHSLIEFGDWNINKGYDHKQMRLVPRHLVCPEKGFVRRRAGEDHGIPYRNNDRFSKNLVEIGGKKDKGLFASLATMFIFKKGSLSSWSDFQQHFGEPILQIATDLLNSQNTDTYYDFIENRGGSGGLVTDIDDVMKVLEAEKTDAYKVYWQMVEMCNAGINKVMEGQSMTTDSEGGKYDGNVHADTALLFRLGRLKSIKYYNNDELLPKMRKDGFVINQTTEFRWREFRNVDEIVNRIVKLANYFHMDPQEVYDMTGIKVGKEREDKAVDVRGGNGKKVPGKVDKD